MKFKQKKSAPVLSDRIADALTVKPKADIEDDQVFGTKPKTLSRVDFSSSESEDENAISDFRKRNVNLLSEISKKYEGEVVSRKDLKSEDSDSDGSFENDDKVPSHADSKNAKEASDSEDFESDDEGNEDTLSKIQKSMAQSDSDQSDEGSDNEDYSITRLQKAMAKSDSEDGETDDDDGETDDEDGETDDDDEGEGYDISQMDEPPKEEFEHVKKQNISEEAKKGACVRNQLLIWERMLEMRIHLQRCLSTANQMPLTDTFNELKSNEQFVDESKKTISNVASALDKLLNLKELLLKNNPETKTLSTDKSKSEKADNKKPTIPESDEEIPSDTEDEEIPSDTDVEDNTETKDNKKTPTVAKKRKLGDYEKELATSHKVFKTFRDTTIQKWNDKTRLATATNMKNAPTNTILQQISYILSDRNKLVKRTQLKRSDFDIVGLTKPNESKVAEADEINPVVRDRKDNDEYIPEIFDDSDFYHQLLRELIECKSADISDPVQLSRQWIALQQMRSKMKRKVDTKATKGRKIKYVVHNQLVNFMGAEKCNAWTDESASELYSSLFGKLFEQNSVGVNMSVDNGLKLK